MSSVATKAPALFTPLKVGNILLQHRVAMAPLTRVRANARHVPTDLMVEYYRQRSSVPGTLLITEATFIHAKTAAARNTPGIWSEEQIEGWKKVTDAVHKNNSFIFLQLWDMGRSGRPEVLAEEAAANGESEPYPYISSSDVPNALRGVPPRPLTLEEIPERVQWFAQAGRNAVKAGFDGIEVHGANGYLVDQFIQDVTNKRTDAYGGPIPNRARFALEVVSAISAAIGPERTAIRLSPYSTYQDMREVDPVPTFTYLIQQLKKQNPDLAYLHVVESADKVKESVDWAREAWKGDGKGVFLSALGHDRESGLKFAEEKGDVIVYGQSFIANPDLPYRLENSLPLTPPNVQTFYTVEAAEGYVDYPFVSTPESENVAAPAAAPATVQVAA